jgi:hypothetical protein
MRRIVSISVSFLYVIFSLFQTCRLIGHGAGQWLASEWQSLTLESGPLVESSTPVGGFTDDFGERIEMSIVKLAKPVRFTDDLLITTETRVRIKCSPSKEVGKATVASDGVVRIGIYPSTCYEGTSADLTKGDAKSFLRILKTHWTNPAKHSKTIRWKFGDLGVVVDVNEKSVVNDLDLHFSGATARISGKGIELIEGDLKSSLQESR